MPGEYRIVLSSDDKKFGGWENIDTNVKFVTDPMGWNNRSNHLQVRRLLRSASVQLLTTVQGLHSDENVHGLGEGLSGG